jgi:hypothetical protein
MNDEFIRVARGVAATKPKERESTGSTKCHYCNRTLPRGEKYYVQWQKSDGFTNDCCAKLCFQCKSAGNNGTMFFERFEDNPDNGESPII